MALRNLVFGTAASAVMFTSITALSWAGGSPPLPKSTLFQAITPTNVAQVRNRLNGSPNDRDQVPVGTVLAYKTSAGNLGKMQILSYGSKSHTSDIYVRFVTYRPDGSILVQRSNFRIKGTWLYDLDTGQAISTLKDRTADLWWEIVDPAQRYLNFENGATFTVVS
jgi:hypothetical protein